MHIVSRSPAVAVMGVLLALASISQAPAAAAAESKDKQAQQAQQAPQPNYSKGFRKEAAKVQKLVTEQKWDEVIAALPALEALPELTDDDRRVIYTWKANAYQSKQDWANLAQTYAAWADSGLVEAGKLPDYYRQVAAIYSSRLKDNVQALVYFRKAVSATPEPTDDDLNLLIQLTRQQKDCPNLIEWTAKASQIVQRRGGAPRENWLQYLDSCFLESGDKDKRLANLEELVRRYPKRDYYTRVTSLYAIGSNNDRIVMINMLRLAMKDVGLATVGEYLAYADIANSLGSPGETVKALERGMADGIVPKGGTNQQLLAEGQGAVAADRKSLPSEEKAAAKAPKGEVDVKVGLGFYGIGEFQKTVDNVRRGLAKGGVKRIDDANMLLGMALVELGKRDEARTAFEAAAKVAGAGSYMERVAGLWIAYVVRQAPPAAAPPAAAPPAAATPPPSG